MTEWVHRNWRNVPGPHYTVDGAYLSDAPKTHLASYEYVTFFWRQPQSPRELGAISDAITALPNRLDRIRHDGDEHWTPDAVRAWWFGREAIARVYRDVGVPDVDAYFERELPEYLRRYAFLLEHRQWPQASDDLPELDAAPAIRVGPPAGDFDGALELYARRHELLRSRVKPGELPLWGNPRERGLLDVPGVFAIAQTAPSSSHAWAPLNLCPTEHGTFVARQPRTTDELERVFDAATQEPLFGMYLAEWTAAQIREHWRKQRVDFERAVRAADLPDVGAYLRDLPQYLRALILLVDDERLPAPGEELPALDDITTSQYWQTPRSDELPYAPPADLDRSNFTTAGFQQRHPENVPGPFYGADSDTCGTGPLEAPSNVACDGTYGQELVYRQPRTVRELRELERAAWAETMDGHACDGNDHWTPELVRAWWAERAAHRAAWRAADVPYADEIFERELPRYLRGYLFFLVHRRVPSPSDELPALE